MLYLLHPPRDEEEDIDKVFSTLALSPEPGHQMLFWVGGVWALYSWLEGVAGGTRFPQTYTA